MVFSTATGGALIGEGPKKRLPFKPKGASIMAMRGGRKKTKKDKKKSSRGGRRRK